MLRAALPDLAELLGLCPGDQAGAGVGDKVTNLMQENAKQQQVAVADDLYQLYTFSKLMQTPHGLLIILHYQNEHSLQYYCIF